MTISKPPPPNFRAVILGYIRFEIASTVDAIQRALRDIQYASNGYNASECNFLKAAASRIVKHELTHYYLRSSSNEVGQQSTHEFDSLEKLVDAQDKNRDLVVLSKTDALDYLVAAENPIRFTSYASTKKIPAGATPQYKRKLRLQAATLGLFLALATSDSEKDIDVAGIADGLDKKELYQAQNIAILLSQSLREGFFAIDHEGDILTLQSAEEQSLYVQNTPGGRVATKDEILEYLANLVESFQVTVKQ